MKEKNIKKQEIKKQEKFTKRVRKYQNKKAVVLAAQKEIVESISQKLGAAKISMTIQSKIDEDKTIMLGAEVNLEIHESIHDGHNRLFGILTSSMEQFI